MSSQCSNEVGREMQSCTIYLIWYCELYIGWDCLLLFTNEVASYSGPVACMGI